MNLFQNAVDPLSTKSSLLWYGAGGLLLILVGLLTSSWVVSLGGVISIGLGVASAVFHATYRDWWRHADMIMIYAFFNIVMARQLFYYIDGWEGYTVFVFLTLAVVMGFTHRRWDHDDVGLMGIYNIIFTAPRAIITRGIIGVVQIVAILGCYGLALYYGRNATIEDSHRHEDSGHAKWHRYSAIGNTLMVL